MDPCSSPNIICLSTARPKLLRYIQLSPSLVSPICSGRLLESVYDYREEKGTIPAQTEGTRLRDCSYIASRACSILR